MCIWGFSFFLMKHCEECEIAVCIEVFNYEM